MDVFADIEKLAMQGNAAAQYNLGWWYITGLGVAKSDQKAVLWLRKAANQGFAAAQCNLGQMYATGTGVSRNARKGAEWYRKAAEQGHAGAHDRITAEKEGKSLAASYTNSLGMRFRLIPAGTFLMGSPDNDKEAQEDECPQHLVTISRPFYMGAFPVSQAEWQAVMGTPKGLFQGEKFQGNELPMDRGSWKDAQAFIAKLNEMEGHERCRLPSEAMWEYACRAGSTRRYCFGADKSKLLDFAWYRANSGKETHFMGQKKPNARGLHDIHGNVWKWVQDWYGDYIEGEDGERDLGGESPDWFQLRQQYCVAVDPVGPESGTERVLRGGGVMQYAGYCRSASRSGCMPGIPLPGFGFRLALLP